MQSHCSSTTEPPVDALRAIADRTVRLVVLAEGPHREGRSDRRLPTDHPQRGGSYTSRANATRRRATRVTAAGCHCPDSTKRGVAACKHQLAVRFALQLGIASVDAPAAAPTFSAEQYTRPYGALA